MITRRDPTGGSRDDVWTYEHQNIYNETRGASVLARVRSAAVIGLEASMVEVEVDVSPGIPTFAVVGLPDAGVREARERVRAAVRNSGYEMPVRRITVNLAPADTRKEGSVFDLPIALGILMATWRGRNPGSIALGS